LSPSPVRALSIHADYGCRMTGACCRSGWDVPVEPDVETRLDAPVAAGTLAAPERALDAALAGWERTAASVPAANPRPRNPRADVEIVDVARAEALVDEVAPPPRGRRGVRA